MKKTVLRTRSQAWSRNSCATPFVSASIARNGSSSEQHLRIIDERARDLRASAHSRGQLVGVAIADIRETELAELSKRLSLALAAPGHAPLHDRTVGDVVDDLNPREERPVLEHDHAIRARLGR